MLTDEKHAKPKDYVGEGDEEDELRDIWCGEDDWQHGPTYIERKPQLIAHDFCHDVKALADFSPILSAFTVLDMYDDTMINSERMREITLSWWLSRRREPPFSYRVWFKVVLPTGTVLLNNSLDIDSNTILFTFAKRFKNLSLFCLLFDPAMFKYIGIKPLLTLVDRSGSFNNTSWFGKEPGKPDSILDTPLYNLNYDYIIQSTTTTKSKGSPLTLEPWPDFRKLAAEFDTANVILESTPMFTQRKVPIIRTESDLYIIWQIALDWAMPALAPADSVIVNSTLYVKGHPDFQLTSNEKPLLVGEMTRCNVIPTGCDLQKTYDEGHNKTNNGLRFGVLTTWDCTWFLMFPSRELCSGETKKTVHVSPGFFLMHLAGNARLEAGKDSSVSVDSTQLTISDHAAEYSGGRSMTANITESAVIIIKRVYGEKLGHGRSGDVYKCVINDTPVAMKVVDSYKNHEGEKAVLRESEVYSELQDLQDNAIPKVIMSARFWRFFLLLGTRLASEGTKKVLDDDDRRLALKSLSAIHAKGYIHGDIRRQNVCFDVDNFGQRRALWIDLESCRPGSPAEIEEERTQVENDDFDP
ncbi:hypothetical protein BC829DRAFT_440600 [Chytridium lagenaria]|nr:hypothetical protein BC829DRAFT_440600 [Chytridium lagenaria]